MTKWQNFTNQKATIGFNSNKINYVYIVLFKQKSTDTYY